MRVLIADDHDVTRVGLRAFLEAERIEVAGEFTRAADAVSAVKGDNGAEPLDVDVAITDVLMPGGDGFAVVEACRDREPPLPVVLYTGQDRPALFDRALTSGAEVLLIKGGDPNALLAGLRAAAEGRRYADPSLGEEAERHWVARRTLGPLTYRELEVLEALAGGGSVNDAAERLGVSVNTVQTHLRRIYAALGRNNLAGAVALAMRRGLIG
jgi:two-component system response regulator DesR